MDIKEIALRIGEEADEYADAKLQSKGEFHPDWHTVRDEYFAEALVAELAKQNEPVAYFSDEFFSINTKQNATFNDPLFSSDQVAAVVLKVTGPLEHELRELRMSTRMRGEDIDELRAQLAAAQEEIKTVTEQKNRMWFEMQTAQDQLAKAEQRVAEYNELIYAVQTKHHDETRHQTALRYIRNAENRQSYTAANGASI